MMSSPLPSGVSERSNRRTLSTMSGTLTNPDTDTKKKRPSGGLPSWPWLLAIVALIGAVAILATMLVARDAGGTAAVASASPSPGVSGNASPTPDSANPSGEPTPPPAQDDLTEGPFDPDMKGKIADILNSQNTAVFAQSGLFHDPVEVHVVGGEDKVMSPDEATMTISFMFTMNDPYAWDLDLSDTYLNAYRTHYAELFPAWAIVARSHNGAVFSFLGHGSVITTVVAVAHEGSLV